MYTLHLYRNCIRYIYTCINITSEELRKLSEDGFGLIVTKEQLHKDKFLPFNQCANLYLKPEPTTLGSNFFNMAKDPDLNATVYSAYWNKEVDDTTKKLVMKYHPHRENILFTQMDSDLGR